MATIQKVRRTGKWNAILYFMRFQWERNKSTELISMKVTWFMGRQRTDTRSLLSYFDDCLYIQHPTDWMKYAMLVRKIDTPWRNR